MPMKENLGAFFNTDEFASVAKFEGGDEITGIFDSNYETVGGGIGMASSSPALTVQTADVPFRVIGRTMMLNDLWYRVANKEIDFDPSLTVLMLEQVA